jgi:hypothetical protein
VVLTTVQVMLSVNADVDPFTPRTFPVLGVYVILGMLTYWLVVRKLVALC